MPVLTVQLLKLAVGGSEMLLMTHSCTASGDGTLEAHGSCGGRVTGAEWQERCWIWIGSAAVIRLQEGLDRRWESWVHDSVHLPLQLVGVKIEQCWLEFLGDNLQAFQSNKNLHFCLKVKYK
uniref:Uncharacterized protein n=1 Tax=Populus alba TaxID=43335 RepID=A0A4U5QMM2_POPAL|nr:hypothetical protein D5086_0000066140 [Populus alba]